jgi:methyltransferase family protein
LEIYASKEHDFMKNKATLTLELLKRKSDPAEIVVKLALHKALAGCKSVLDVGCGASPTMRQMGISHSVGIEGYKPSLDQAIQLKTHDEIIHGDVKELGRHFSPKQFDACVALDVIEHLAKEDGIKLMRDMEKIAAKKVIFFTPCGFLPQRHAANDDLQEHLSGWEPAEMRGYGYDVIGLLGPKKLRGEYHVIKGRPRIFWGAVSLTGHFLWTRKHPEKAAAILCVKDLSDI